MAGVKYEFFKRADGQLLFRLKAANGKILAGSEDCESEPAAQHDITPGTDSVPDGADVHEPEQHVETPRERTLRMQRKLNALAKPFKISKKDGNPS